MGNINDIIKDKLGDLMRDSYGLDVVSVTSWEDTTASTGYCPTCYYEYAAVEVGYTDSKGKKKKWTYDGSFSELINYLDD